MVSKMHLTMRPQIRHMMGFVNSSDGAEVVSLNKESWIARSQPCARPGLAALSRFGPIQSSSAKHTSAPPSFYSHRIPCCQLSLLHQPTIPHSLDVVGTGIPGDMASLLHMLGDFPRVRSTPLLYYARLLTFLHSASRSSSTDRVSHGRN